MPSDDVPTEHTAAENTSPENNSEETSAAEEAVGEESAGDAAGDADAVDFPAEADEAVAETADPDADSAVASSEGASGAGPGDRRLALVTFVVLPLVAMVVALAAGFTKWQANSQEHSRTAAIETVQVATETTVDMLSYQPDTVEEDLTAVHDRLTDGFREEYRTLTDDVVIPGAREQQIATVATVPAAASMSADSDSAEVLVFVNQTVTIGSDPPSNTTSSVKVSLERHGQRWLVSAFEPI